MVLSMHKFAAVLAVASCLLHGAAVAQDVETCSLEVSEGDAAKGLAIVADSTCAIGGEGCIDTICRHCNIVDTTPASEFPTYPSCGDYVQIDVHDDAVAEEYTGSADGNGSEDDNGSDDSSGSADADADDYGGSGVLGALPDNLTVDSPVSGTSYGCPFPTLGGDFAAGIQLVGDPTCNRGGLGCVANVCRFCKFQETTKSSHLLTCASLGYQISAPVVVPVLPPANPETGCPFSVSGGDFAVGVQLVGDASCVNGGLGCFKDVCRYCKFKETPQSAHWRSCAEFGYPRTPAPTFATVSLDDESEWDGATGCAYAVAKGDFAVGVQLVGDASCATGGLGCFGDTCRFCQFRETPQSKHMLPCASLGYPRAPQPIGTTLDIADPVTGCPFAVSSGDFAAGVQLVGDTSCAKGGLGCFKDVCRFCKFKETPQSNHWVPCADYNYPPVAPPVVQPADINEPAVDYGTGCPYPVSSGDYAAGVQLVGDATCAKGGHGCFKDVCRFCKFEETPQSKHWVSCASLGWPKTVAPIARPVDIAEVDPATKCPFPVSSGDFAAGIQLVGDAACVKGGLGCYKNVCRFCQFNETPQSKHWVKCSDLGYPTTTFAPTDVMEPIDTTGCPFPVSSGDYASGVQLVGDGTCTAGGTGCFKDICRFCKFRTTPQSDAYLNCEDLGYFFGTDSDAIVPAPPSDGPSTKCPFKASVGDLAAGVLLVGDATCEKGGTGCFKDVCRYCQLVPTEKSNQFVTCASLGYDYALPPMPTVPAPTLPSPPTALPAVPAVPTLPPCPFAVSPGDFAVGIQLVGDATCSLGGVGCFENVCRYCKLQETPQAAHWLPCANYMLPVAAPAEVEITAPPVPAPTPAPIVAVVCNEPVSQGDKDAGVGLATDYSCLIAGVGCVKDTVCRFCKVFQTEKSSHMEPCSKYGAVPAPAIVAPTPAAADSTVCTSQLAVGHAQGGVSAVYDASCSTVGGVGCFGGVCRYCQVFLSDKSKDFGPCPTQAPVAPGLPASNPIAAPVVAPFRAAAKELSTRVAASVSRLDELLKDKTFRWTIVGAACVGVVAVIALVALGAKRVVTRRRSAVSADEETEESDELDVATETEKPQAATGVQEDQV